MGGFVPSLWVVLLPFCGAALVAVLGAFKEKIVPYLAVGIGILDAGIALSMIPRICDGASFAYRWLPGIADFTLVPDGIGAFIAATASVLGALILVYSLGYMKEESGKTRYYALVLLFVGAMSGLVLSGSLLTLYFFWEICGICSYSLIGFHYDDPKALKGAIKAFITTRIGDVGLLSGIIVLYLSGSPRTMDIATITSRAGSYPAAALGFAAFAMLLGAMGKSAQFPLHVWLPDAMEAPTSVSALIHAATMVNAGVYLMARMYPVFSRVPGWTAAVTWVGVATLFLAALMAIAAKDLKRMLAYSTVSQLGYMFFAIGSGAILASQFHLVSHAVFKALLFLAAGSLIHEAGTRDMGKLSGAGLKMPWTGRLFLIGTMGLSGIPLMGGFFSKDMIFSGALAEGAYVPLGFAVAAAVLTFTYSWRAYLRVFAGKPSEAVSHAHEVPMSMRWPMMALGVGAVMSWLMIGVQSAKFPAGAVSGAGATAERLEAISPLGLVEETFTSPAFLLSLAALALGLLLVKNRERVYEWLDKSAGSFMAAAYQGFYVDQAYLSALGFLEKIGSRSVRGLDRVENGFLAWSGKAIMALNKLAAKIDFQFIEGSGRGVASSLERSSDAVHRAHDGDLNGNLVKLVIGVSMVLVIVLVAEMGVRI